MQWLKEKYKQLMLVGKCSSNEDYFHINHIFSFSQAIRSNDVELPQNRYDNPNSRTVSSSFVDINELIDLFQFR
jgi:hypothetical protein